jgi:hypothetical protein
MKIIVMSHGDEVTIMFSNKKYTVYLTIHTVKHSMNRNKTIEKEFYEKLAK